MYDFLINSDHMVNDLDELTHNKAEPPTRLQTQSHLKVKKPGDPAFEAHLDSLAHFQRNSRPTRTPTSRWRF
jgi:hypothetical protein